MFLSYEKKNILNYDGLAFCQQNNVILYLTLLKTWKFKEKKNYLFETEVNHTEDKLGKNEYWDRVLDSQIKDFVE